MNSHNPSCPVTWRSRRADCQPSILITPHTPPGREPMPNRSDGTSVFLAKPKHRRVWPKWEGKTPVTPPSPSFTSPQLSSAENRAPTHRGDWGPKRLWPEPFRSSRIGSPLNQRKEGVVRSINNPGVGLGAENNNNEDGQRLEGLTDRVRQPVLSESIA